VTTWSELAGAATKAKGRIDDDLDGLFGGLGWLDAVIMELRVRVQLADYKSDMRRTSEVTGKQLPADPAAIEGFADEVDQVAEARLAAAEQLEAISDQTLPAVIVGMTGATAQQATLAMAKTARLHAQGLQISGKALKDYAEAAETHRKSIGNAIESLVSARRSMEGIHINSAAFGGDRSVAEAEVNRLRSAAGSPMRRASSALGSVAKWCQEMAEEARTLETAISDASGYLLLLEVPAGMTALDVVVVRSVTLNGDPDSVVLSDSEWEAYQQAWDGLSAEERKQLSLALADLADPLAKALLMSTLAGGAPLKTVVAFADALRDADQKTLEELASLRTFAGKAGDDPQASAGGTEYVQMNGTTCGPTSLIALVAAKDPLVAYWLVTGKTVDGYVPAYLKNLDLTGTTDDGTVDLTDTAKRIGWLESQVQDRANTLWPTQLGITPYGADSELARAGLQYDVVWSDQAALDFLPGDAPSLDESLARAASAINKGEPVPMFVGSNQESVGPAEGLPGVPRHYVLAVGYHDGVFDIYEPSSGQTFQVSKEDLETTHDSGQPGFGYWTKLHGMLLPAA
jgi:hypothetical protein